MSSQKPYQPAKVLLVDDRKENLLALESLLKAERMEIFKAFSAREALELLLKHRFAVALLDVQMPEINGFELAELMRGSDHTKEIPIIFVTAGAIDSMHTFQGYEVGAVDFLYKPLDPRIVKSKVQVFLRMEDQRLQIEAQMEQLQAALRVREEFLALASHELKTPLTSLVLQLQLAGRAVKPSEGLAPSPEKLAKTFDIANRQIGKLTRLIDDLLDISRIQAGKLIITKSNVDMASLVREVIERLYQQIEPTGCRIFTNLEDQLMVPCEAIRVEQVLINLISNAIKYAPGAALNVRLFRDDKNAFLSVSDEGPGIPEDRLGMIFNRFERGVAPLETRGLGLGLYIVKQIMTAHGGEIKVSSVVGKGTTFLARFPLF